MIARHRLHTEATVARMNPGSKNRSRTISSSSSGRWSMVHEVVRVVVASSLIMALLDDVTLRALLAGTLVLRRSSIVSGPAGATGLELFVGCGKFQTT